jgi:ABC-type antimicrobial peptide transport system permease subunit
MLTALGVVGLLLAAVGIYGVIAFFVSQRTGEIGVRMALGATPAHVVALIVGQGMRPVLAGILIGAAAAVAATRMLESQLFGVRAIDPPTFAAVAALIVLTAVLASALPAGRAARVEPYRALDTS